MVRRNIKSPNFTHLGALFLYLQKDGRKLVEIGLTNGFRWSGLCSTGYSEEACTCGTEFGNLSGHELSGTERWLGDEFCGTTSQTDGTTYATKQTTSKGNKRAYESASAQMGKEIASLLEKWSPSKLDEIKLIPGFEDDYPFIYWSPVYEKYVTTAWEHHARKWNTLNLETMIEVQFANPLKYLLSNHVPYYNPLYSSQLLGKLILDQTHSVENAIEFVDNLITVINKKDPKKNTFVLYGPPSCGKSFTINSLLKLIWNEGNIENTQKNGSEFTFQEAYNTRAALWNECVLNGNKNIQQSKCVWEGLPTAIQVKHKKGTILTRTPIFVTTNHLPWKMCPHEAQAFKDRCFMYSWQRAVWLAETTLKPHPLAWKYIVDNYKDFDWWNDLPIITAFFDRDNIAKIRENCFIEELQTTFQKEEIEFVVNNCNLYSSYYK